MSSTVIDLFVFVFTLLIPGSTNWFTSNFSAAGASYPGNILLFFWVLIIGFCFYKTTRRIIGQTAPFLSAKKELFLTDLAVLLFIGSVFFPYLPESRPVIASIHLAMAFSSTVLFFLILVSLNRKLYQIEAHLFSLTTILLIGAAIVAFILLVLCRFLISSALEIFLTLFAYYWLRLFETKVVLCRSHLQSDAEKRARA